jgi:bifunctional non-homologous end joining protein LigD
MPREQASRRRRSRSATRAQSIARGRGAPETAYRQPQPSWLEPMLATLVEARRLPAGWIYEPKLDGIRCLAFVNGVRGARLVSRNRIAVGEDFADIAAELAERARGRGVFDGEIVAIDPRRGVPSFSLLQRRKLQPRSSATRRPDLRLEYWLFDCLWWEGLDLRRLPLVQRKQVLQDAVAFGGPIVLTPCWEDGFERRYRRQCSDGGEGLVGKRLESRYTAGRSRDWVKLKCTARQEFVVGGWTDPKGSREALGALLVGYHERGRLRYAGRVGTGFDRATLAALWAELIGRSRPGSPFDEGTPKLRGVHWTEPSLVVEVAFSEWTADGRLRHPRFLGVRTDKAARRVLRESGTGT